MRWVVLSGWICLSLSILLLVSGFTGIGYWQFLWIGLVMLSLWIFGVRWNKLWAINTSMVGFSLATAAGAWLGMGEIWSILSVVFLLSAWDLQWFAWRLDAAEQIEGEKQIVWSHMFRLMAIAGVGLLLSGIALSVHLRLGFGITLLLGLSVILGLKQWLSIARRSGE